jgi:hypothetical protein
MLGGSHEYLREVRRNPVFVEPFLVSFGLLFILTFLARWSATDTRSLVMIGLAMLAWTLIRQQSVVPFITRGGDCGRRAKISMLRSPLLALSLGFLTVGIATAMVVRPFDGVAYERVRPRGWLCALWCLACRSVQAFGKITLDEGREARDV